MFNFFKSLKTKLLNLWNYFFPLKVVTKPVPQKSPDLRRNRDRASYNQKTEVKSKKRLLYLRNKERYYLNRKKKRDLDRKLKKES